jgi:hypothetical protein
MEYIKRRRGKEVIRMKAATGLHKIKEGQMGEEGESVWEEDWFGLAGSEKQDSEQGEIGNGGYVWTLEEQQDGRMRESM